MRVNVNEAWRHHLALSIDLAIPSPNLSKGSNLTIIDGNIDYFASPPVPSITKPFLITMSCITPSYVYANNIRTFTYGHASTFANIVRKSNYEGIMTKRKQEEEVGRLKCCNMLAH